MKLPQDVSGRQLGKALGRWGYALTRQKGSHMRFTTQQNGEHHVAIPDHDPVRVGTLNGILKDVAVHLGLSLEGLLRDLGL
jgi:predicted RNA binding protein YcfA (HicA-like mRNA interferase family)